MCHSSHIYIETPSLSQTHSAGWKCAEKGRVLGFGALMLRFLLEEDDWRKKKSGPLRRPKPGPRPPCLHLTGCVHVHVCWDLLSSVCVCLCMCFSLHVVYFLHMSEQLCVFFCVLFLPVSGCAQISKRPTLFTIVIIHLIISKLHSYI